MFHPRLTAPEADNPYYIADDEGGLNPGIPRPKGSPLHFANCVFYALGRYAENFGKWLPSVNAEDLIRAAKDMGLRVSQTPVPGALAVWAKGKTGDGTDGAGHVAAVEQVNRDGSIVTSESGWHANKSFWTQTRRDDGNWGQGRDYRFLGFILPPEPERVLRKGDRGEAVREMQRCLCECGYLRRSEIDGDFGKITLGAVCGFQLEQHLEVDGICGPRTWEALRQAES
ncbi:MAG: peptidoglycan-binding protein [Oscillospiraceae bacterium]|nr:peptidoglycan-binding protein [Oscillospiraceae bacterium]